MGDHPLAGYCLHDARVVLVPVEELTDAGVTATFARLLRERAGWSAGAVALFDTAWVRWWERSGTLARRTPTWPAPRRRHVVVVAQPDAVRPYVPLLEASAWPVYASDVDPATSDPELLAYVLALGDRMARTGAVETAAVHAAPWWFERTDEECAAFAAAAARSVRPDAAAYAAVAEAIPWLRRLHHADLRPPPPSAAPRAIPGSGLFVPPDLEREPTRLDARWTDVASAVGARYRATWRRSDAVRVTDACDWLAADAPPLLVLAGRERVVWDPAAPTRVNALRRLLKDADVVAVDRVRRDLERVAAITRRFAAAAGGFAALPEAPPVEQAGCAFLHTTRGLIAYDLHEPGMERLSGPALPYEGLLVGADTAYAWARAADTAGWVLRTASPSQWAGVRSELAAALDDALAHAPAAVRSRTAADLAALAAGRPVGVALGRLLLARLPDYRASLVARALVTDDEGETWVRHGLRGLGERYEPAQAWRLLAHYLVEYQYATPALGLTRVADPRAFFLARTGIADELFASGVVDEARFDDLAAIVGRLCTAHAVDATMLRFT